MSTMDDDMSHDDADYGDGCEDGKPGLAAFLGGHVGLPVGQGFGFGGDAAGGAGGGERVARDRQVELVALAVAPEPVELFGRHHADGVEPVSTLRRRTPSRPRSPPRRTACQDVPPRRPRRRALD